MSDNLKEKSLKAFVWDFSGKMASQGIGLIISIFLARLLEPSEFGLVAMVMVVFTFASVFTDSGLGVALIQRRKVTSIHYTSVFYFNLLMGSIFALIVFYFSESIAEFYENEELTLLTQVLSVTFILGALGSVQSIQFRKELNLAIITKIMLFSSVISGVVGIILALNGAGVWSLVTQNILGGIVSNILLWTYSKWRPNLTFSFKALKQLWSFGFHMFLNNILDTFLVKLDTLIIGKMFTPALLGFYNRAKSLDQLIVSYSAGSLLSVLFPVLSKIQHDFNRFREVVLKIFGVLNFIVFLLLGIFYLISEELIVLLFSEKWLPSVEYFQILILSGFHYPLSGLLNNVLTSRGKSKLFFYVGIIKKAIYATNLYIGFLWGIEGFLYGLIVVSFLNFGINLIYAAKEVKIRVLNLLDIFLKQMLIAVVSVWIVMFLMKNIDLNNFVSIICESIIYSVTYFLINIVFKSVAYRSFSQQVYPMLKKIEFVKKLIIKE